MKSLLERARARPYHAAALVIAAVAAIALLWWLLCPQASTTSTTSTTIKTVTNVPIVQSSALQSDTASVTTTTSEVTATDVAPVTTVNTALPTDPAMTEEELDRLNDEQARLKDRKTQLARQLEMSNKLLALKEQQLKTLETPNH
ncbi:MAG: hypothetical protein H7Z73_02805 [Candidatus Saccharibacteria bacterium]|nr:hypothetical protein [Moraxellaceae bacterium]